MHLKSLKIYCDVVRKRSFSQAAAENNITQSGASQAVHQLEEHLSVQLLDRSTRPFEVTPEGQMYYERSRELLKQYQALEEDVRNLHREISGRVTVASIYSVGLSSMKHYVNQFHDRNPHAEIQLEYHHPEQVYAAVESGQANIGLVSYPKATRAIKVIPWREERMVAVFSRNHPLADREHVSITELGEHAMVGFDENLRIRQEVNKLMSNHGVIPTVVMEFDNIEMLKRAIEINEGVSLLPEPHVEREVAAGTLCTAQIEGPPVIRPIGIMHRRSPQLSETTARFIELLLSDDQQQDNNSVPTIPSTVVESPIAGVEAPQINTHHEAMPQSLENK